MCKVAYCVHNIYAPLLLRHSQVATISSLLPPAVLAGVPPYKDSEEMQQKLLAAAGPGE